MTATIAFLGTGSMNGSIAAGLLAAGHDPAHIRATVRSKESRAALAQRLGDKVEIITTGGEADGNHKATAHADVVLLGVKPYGIVELARDIAPALAPNAVVVSVAAGVTLDTLAECLPAGQPIVRCMPNFLLDTNPDAPALRRAVTSPNGTTERALNTFVDGGLFQLTEQAMRACAARSAEMSKLYTADED